MMFSVFSSYSTCWFSFNWSIRVHGCVESRLIWLHQYSFYGIFQLLLLCYSLTTMEYLKRERERKKWSEMVIAMVWKIRMKFVHRRTYERFIICYEHHYIYTHTHKRFCTLIRNSYGLFAWLFHDSTVSTYYIFYQFGYYSISRYFVSLFV